MDFFETFIGAAIVALVWLLLYAWGLQIVMNDGFGLDWDYGLAFIAMLVARFLLRRDDDG